MSTATSLRSLAERVGKSHVAVSKWVADPRWPFARRAPWDAATVAKILDWATNTLAPNPAASGDPVVDPSAANDLATKQKLVTIKGGLARAKLAETRNQLLLSELVPKSEVEAARLERIHAVKTGLFNLVDSGLVDQIRTADNLADAKALLRARLIVLCQEFAGATAQPH